MAPLYQAQLPFSYGLTYQFVAPDELIEVPEALALILPVTLDLEGTIDLDGSILEV